MKKIITALASGACLLCATSAHAALYKFEFETTNFRDYDSIPPPDALVKGWITFTADSLGAPVTSIDAVDLTIAGHNYTPEEIGALSWSTDSYLFGGTALIVNGIGSGTNDFYVTGGYLSYTVSGIRGIWNSSNGIFSYTELVAEVPEPGSLALLLTGAGSLGAMLRRRRRQA